jgi:serine/threonine protein kinase
VGEVPYQRVKEVYFEASQIDAAGRSSYLDQACDGDADLRREVERLLGAGERDPSFMDTPLLDHSPIRHTAAVAAEESIPAQIGRYRIIRLIGEGGMGYVYEAEQDTPHRIVALKVIRAALPSRRMVQRFEREVEILGRLHHPNIAHIYDAGIAAAPAGGGRVMQLPYYAMEYIDGVPLTEYTAINNLSDHDRLKLLAIVCDAVDYGHRQGVVHRDLKPSNILVKSASTKGGAIEPKIIDFGVARAANLDHSVATLNTHSGMLIGTLAYMSPEQVGGAPSKTIGAEPDSAVVDGRSDVYSLGVIGFELLCGRLPYDLTGCSIPEAARVIRDEDPSSLGSISRTQRGDVETILRRAMAKEPDRRYQSAGDMADDIRRFLSDQPIMARPPSLRYQLGKFARRHKEFVTAIVTVFVVLVAGIIGTTAAMIAAHKNADAATTQARRALAAGRFMKDVLASSNPALEGGGRNVRVADVLDHAVRQLDQSPSVDPAMELQARWTIGESYFGLGLHEESLRNLRRAMELAVQESGPQSRDALQLAEALAWVLIHIHSYDEATALVEPALATSQETLGPADECTLSLLYAAACVADAGSDCEAARTHLIALYDAIQPLAASDRAINLRTVFVELASSAQELGEWEESQAWITQAIAQPATEQRHPVARWRVEASLAAVLANQQMLSDAESAWRRILNENEGRFGPDHFLTRTARGELEGVLMKRGDFAGARVCREHDLQSISRISPVSDTSPLMAWGNMGVIEARRGSDTEASAAFSKAVQLSRQHRGDEYFLTQAWWREAVIRLGMGLHDPWMSETLRWQCLRSIDDALRAHPTQSFAFDEIDWDSMRFTLEKYQPHGTDFTSDLGNDRLVSGDLQALKSQADPAPGIYELQLRAERRGGPAIETSAWMLVAPWNVRTFKVWPCAIDNPARWKRAAETFPTNEQTVSSLCFSNWWEGGFGPSHDSAWHGLEAKAVVTVPAGEYDLAINLDDGARIWLDDELVFDDWTNREWGFPVNHSVRLHLSQKEHFLRVEHFQGLGEARLWLRLEPAIGAQ